MIDIRYFYFRAPGIRVKLYHGSNKNERARNLEKVQRRKGVCLTTYGKLLFVLDIDLFHNGS